MGAIVATSHGYDPIELYFGESVEPLRFLTSDIDSKFGHGVYGFWIDHPRRTGARAKNIDLGECQVASESFGHLRAVTIFYTDKYDVQEFGLPELSVSIALRHSSKPVQNSVGRSDWEVELAGKLAK